MGTHKLGFAALGLACVIAAGGGAYVASRHNADDLAAQTAAAAATQKDTTAIATKAAPTVAETEAVIDEAKSKAPAATAEAPESVPAVAPAPVKTSPASAPAPSVRAPSPRVATEARRPGTAPTTPQHPASANPPAAVASTLPVDQPRPATPTPQTDARPETPVEPAAREPEKSFEELVVQPDSVIGLQIQNTLNSERARVEDRVEARVTRDVKVGDRVAIPAGSHVIGTVTQVERGGKVRERARLGVRFHTLVLADGSRVPISTETLYREGEAPTKESAAKIGGATVGGALLGAILGGGKGAAAGAVAGAAGGTAAVMAGDRNPATLTAGTTVTVRVLSPVTITVEK